MKKLLVLLLASSALLAGCEKDNDSLPGIKPVKADAALTAFFEENLWMVSRSVFAEDGYVPQVDTCVMFNGMEEFEAIDFGAFGVESDLPPVDFEKYTLVVGQYLSISSINRLLEQRVEVGRQSILMNTLMNVKVEFASQPTIQIKPYWGLYPKLPNLPIFVVRKNNN